MRAARGASASAQMEGHFSKPTRRGWSLRMVALLFLLALLPSRLLGELQFDLFLGYENAVREASWIPITIEVRNDGPAFRAVVEVFAGSIASEQVRRVPIELPPNTQKRFTIPVFAGAGRQDQWNARLIDERGEVRAERQAQGRVVPWENVLLAAVPRAFNGAPQFPEPASRRADLMPVVARLQPDVFPDNPIALESLTALYLNSEKAITLRANQISALLTWLHGGGHVILAVEQGADVSSTPWLQQLVPCDFTATATVAAAADFQAWLPSVPTREQGGVDPGVRSRRQGRNSQSAAPEVRGAGNAVDAAFADAQVLAMTGALRKDGRVLLASHGTPLVIEAPRGRGKITVLAFSPEREPFRSWKNKGWFWAKVAGIPPAAVAGTDITAYGGWSIDGVFGALIDSRQIRKLPVEWLLALLLVYLVVIGPFDQWWLKKINRQMLTWITFPLYVAAFSLLIYFIGYKLRAGETEWNELHLVDVLPKAGRAELRGRSYISVYSSANATYPLESDQSFATLRGELLDLFLGGKEGSKVRVEQRGNAFRAAIDVPVWTSLLYVNDWLQPGNLPLAASLSRGNQGFVLEVENPLDRPLADLRLALRNQIYELGAIEARARKKFELKDTTGIPLSSFLQSGSMQGGASFFDTVQARRQALGGNLSGKLEDPSLVSAVASFHSQIPAQANQRRFVAPAGLDLTPVLDRGSAVLLAWDAGHSLIKPVNQFKPVRTTRNTLLRLAIPVEPQEGR